MLTETTTTTTPTPPEGLTDERLLELAAAAIPLSRLPAELIEMQEDGSELIAYARAAIAAHEAARPTPAPVPTFLDAIRLANGCHDYSGGYCGAEGEAWHAGIGTVVTVLRRAAAGPGDSQVTAVFAMGADTPAPTPEELEPQLLAWWAVPPDAFDRRTKAGKDQAVAFALRLLGLGVQ